MKTKDSRKRQGWSKQKQQFAALGALSLLLAVVLVLQFRGGEAELEVAALAPDAVDAAAQAQVVEAPVQAAPVVQDNAVLSQAPAELELPANPFKSFWSHDTGDGQSAAMLPPPSVVLGITIPGGERPVAVIDGELLFVGDTVQGWTIEEVRPRAVVLRSPSQQQAVVEMPIFRSELVLPESAGTPR
ncbi:MAG TPA: hypothetical protein VFD43_06440 [Planctomycetota bacterium]|nr:hypothetical protein [Planctomycetota bacterium]